jgi:putative hydrolases of HD superfamily
MTSIQSYVDLFHEVGMLALIPRSGFAFLGSGQQSVAEHSYRVTIIAYALSSLVKQPINQHRLVMMCLFHDLPESRIGDLNYVQKKYVTANTNKVLEELETQSPVGPEIVDWINEYEKGETLEAQLAHDADQLE